MIVIIALSLLLACTNTNISDPITDHKEDTNLQDQENLSPDDYEEPDESDESDDPNEPDDSDEHEELQEPDEPIDPVSVKIEDILNSMTLHEKVCQMLIITLDSVTGVTGTTIAGDITKEALDRFPVGGVIHFGPNITSGDQITLLNSTLQEISTIPLLIAVDEEGGRVARLRHSIRAHTINAMLTYENEGPEKAFENALILSDALKTHGFNTNFAPVADVWSNRANTVIGNRAFSTDFEIAADLVAAAVQGFNTGDIACSLKHFPGHGDTREDSHYSSAYLNKTLSELRDREFLPFVAGIAAGAHMVMTGHLIVPEIDELPATLSKTLLTDILRDELGFTGVIITDSLAMNAVSRNFTVEYIAVIAINAGVDILLMPASVEDTVNAIIEATQNSEITLERINESVRRIIKLKISIGLIEISE